MLYYTFSTYQYFKFSYGRDPRITERIKILFTMFFIYVVRAIIFVLRKVIKKDEQS